MKPLCTYLHLVDGKPVYVGEGSHSRPWDFFTRTESYHEYIEDKLVKVVVVGYHGDKVSSELNEQGLISWLGFENLQNKLKHQGSGYPSYGFQGRKHSEEWLKEHRKRLTGHVVSEETRRKIGKKNRGSTVPDERKRRISETKKSRKLTCPHCGMVGGVSNMRRYHFDHCKRK